MHTRYIKGSPLPDSIGRCADLYREVEDLKRAMQKETDEVGSRLTEIREHIIANLSKSDDTGAAGLKYRAQIKQSTKASVTDWDAFWDYIFVTERRDLLQRRVSEKAVLDMIEAGDAPPGVERVHIPSVSITKI